MAESSVCCIVRDERYKDHIPDFPHVESAKRLTAIYDALDQPVLEGSFHYIEPRQASPDELKLIHTDSYVRLVASTQDRQYVSLDPDTQTSPLSYQTACLAVGGFLNLVEHIYKGEARSGFALVRPPGHHAEKDRAMGFCLFNNVAVGARYLTQELGAQRVLIVDWDLHHGNGTQHSFYGDDDVLYFSTHQYPFYPGSGTYNETGAGKGEGFTVNIPLSSGHGDSSFLQCFAHLLRPIALQFKPDMILVSAGFDTHYLDPLGGMEVTDRGFALMTRLLKDMADQCCGGRLALTLEGGYSLEALQSSVMEVIKELAADKNEMDTSSRPWEDGGEPLIPQIEKVIAVHEKYWSFS